MVAIEKESPTGRARINARLRREDLLRELNKCVRVCEKKTSLAILRCVKLVADPGGLSLYATDLDVQIHTWVPLDGVGIYASGEACCVDVFDLASTIKAMDGDVVCIEPHGAFDLRVYDNSSEAILTTQLADDFPRMVTEIGTSKRVSKSAVRVVTQHVMEFVSTDETRYVLNGVHFGGGWAVSTDGHRLAMVRSDIGPRRDVIVQRKGMLVLDAMCRSKGASDVDISFTTDRMVAEMGRTTLHVRLIDGRFPDHTQVLPRPSKENHVVRANRKALLKCAERVCFKGARGMRVSLQSGDVTLSCADGDIGERAATLNTSVTLHDCDTFKCCLNARYFIAALDSFAGDEVELRFSDELSPVLIRPMVDGKIDDDASHVIMPMRF